MEDMSEGDLLPKNMIKFQRYTYSLYFCQSSYGKWERGGDGEGEKGAGERRESGEEGRGEEGGGEEGRGADGGSTYSSYCYNVFLSLQICEEELKN